MEKLEWPNRGFAYKTPYSTNDCESHGGRYMYQTSDGFRVRETKYGWQAQYKGFTTRWKPTPNEAIEVLEYMITREYK